MAIQRQTGKGKPTIWRWQARFMAKGVDGLLHEATRPAGKPPLSAEVIERVVEMTLAEPLGEATHWTCRAMAKAAGVSHRSVQRIWAAHGLKPHRVRTFKLSNDPKFAAKVQDVIGLYVDPPEHALVLSVDEKSHVWMAPRSQAKRSCRGDGLLAVMCPASSCDSRGRRPRWVFAGWNLIKSSGLTPLTSPGFSSSVGAPDRSITFSSLQGSADRYPRSMLRPSADSFLPWPSKPRRSEQSYWRGPPPL
jgi:transposase